MKNDGGPAFPVSRGHFTDDWKLLSSDGMPGMSLRDWFAGQALSGLLAYESQRATPTDAAAAAYTAADAMLAEREKEQCPS